MLCQHIADVYPKNYYCWTHRKWAVEVWQAACRERDAQWTLPKDGSWQDQAEALLREDFRLLEGWAAQVSDHSGFHHRQVLLRLRSQHHPGGPAICLAAASGKRELELLASPEQPGVAGEALEAVYTLWSEEVILCQALLDRYPAKEALWMHLRACLVPLWVLSNLIPETSSAVSASQATLQKVLVPMGPCCTSGPAEGISTTCTYGQRRRRSPVTHHPVTHDA